MTNFEKWWASVEHDLITTGRDDMQVIAALKAVANEAWDAAIIRAAKTVLGRIKEADLAATKAEEEQDVKNAVHLRLVTFDLWLTVGGIKELKSD